MPEALRKFNLALVAQIPLASGLYLKWNQVLQRPFVAATIGLLYEIAVLAVAFSKKVWAELEKDAIKATADWVRAAARNFKPGFRRRYNKEIIYEHGVFNVRGLGLINTFTLKLDQVFVDLRIAPSGNPQRSAMDPIAVKVLTGNRPIWEFLGVKRRKDEPAAALAVLGPPGCGKTTLLQHVALTLATNRQRRYRLRAYTPVLLFLRDHVATITEKPDITLGAIAEGHSRKQFQKLKPPSDWFERQLQRGKCLVLLDGLDEVAEREKREAMSQWVDRQIREYQQCPFIVSSRPQGYLAAPLQRAHVVEVQPFNSGQVRSFVDNWYLANEIVASGNKDDDEVRRRARKDASDLLERLKKLPSLSALTVNPLLLTMIAMVHRYHGALPGSRVELYNEICEVLLGRWRQVRGVKDNMTAAQKRSVLQPLAAEMMKCKLREIAADEAMKIIRPLLDSVGLSNEQAKTALSDFQAGSGLLLERETGQWSFAHLTFQEFLTAAHWLEEKNATPNWNEIAGDSWWHETSRLYAAHGDATWIAKACLDNGSIPALTLAFDCAEEARKLDAGTRAEINARLIEGLESDDPGLRRIAAEVRLARRLKSLQRIDDKREIDLTYLTCAEYQLFLDDMRAQGRYCQPDHWTDFTFARGQAREPVCGVRYEDAEGFCKWLNERQGGESLFRLPFASETGKLQPENLRIAAWCGDQKSPVGLIHAIEQELRRKLMSLMPTRLPLLQLSARALALASEIDPDLSIAFAIAIAIARDRALDLDLAHARARDLIRALAPDLAHARDLSHGRARARARTRARDVARARARDRDLVRDYARACVVALSFDIQGFARAIEQGDIAEAHRLGEDLMDDSNSAVAQWGELLNALLAVAAAVNPIEMRAAQRRYAACVFEYAYEGYKTLNKVDRPLWQMWLGIRRKGKWEEKEQIALEAYWWLQIVRLREEGKLDAWEGIRIVKEQVDS
jgi:hypothetical protein